VSKRALEHLARYLELTLGELAESLPVTERTIQRRSPRDRFNPAVSEQILEIAEVAARGTEVFEDRDRFLAWLNQPNAAFAGRTAASLLGSRFGAGMILDELGRIEHGIYS
jgi:putative toxin-antitoxin system antitoxin component (TIGR02293 family)